MIDVLIVFFFKQKTAYEMRISDWSSDVCSSDLQIVEREEAVERRVARREPAQQPHAHRFADHGYRREEAGDHLRAPEAHLPPGQHIAHERGDRKSVV